MTSTTLVRSATKRRLRDLLESASELSGVDVSYGPPRNPTAGAVVAFGDTLGELTVAAMRAGRVPYDDRFVVEIIVGAFEPGDSDHELVDRRAEELAEAVRSIVAERPTLALIDGGDGLDGIVAAVVEDLDGPTPWRTPDGVGAACRVFVAVHARIT
jgi:hypothetical protein